MGASTSSYYYDYSDEGPPSPQFSMLYVYRNGRYEPQNLMPVMPHFDRDSFDFDGFVMRGNGRHGRGMSRPPDMTEASLVKNPASIRRDTVKLKLLENGDGVLSFIFDAAMGGSLVVRVVVEEVERRPEGAPARVAESIEDEEKPRALTSEAVESADEAVEERRKHKKKKNTEGPSFLELHALESTLDVETRSFQQGLGQRYESPPVDFGKWPLAKLTYDPKNPRHIPIAVRLEPDAIDDEARYLYYTYISLQSSSRMPAADTSENGEPRDESGKEARTAQVVAQKLQHGDRSYVLHEVFGVNSKGGPNDAESQHVIEDAGNTECVICLSEPRDTAVLPCRHLCFCTHCAGIVRLQCDRCPVCRNKVAKLLQFKHSGKEQDSSQLNKVGRKVSLTRTGVHVGAAVAASAANNENSEFATDAVTSAPRTSNQSLQVLGDHLLEARARSSVDTGGIR